MRLHIACTAWHCEAQCRGLGHGILSSEPCEEVEKGLEEVVACAHQNLELVLEDGEALAGSHAQLPLHQVLPCDGLCDWVLHLCAKHMPNMHHAKSHDFATVDCLQLLIP